MRIVETVLVPVADLKSAPYNPRVMSEAAHDGLAASMERFGLVQDIVVNKRSMRVVGGHQRVEVLRQRSVAYVTAKLVDLDEDEEIRLNLTLNSEAICGEWTTDGLRECLAKLGMLERPKANGQAPSYDQLVLGDIVPPPPPRPPEEFPEHGAGIATEYRCPSCAYEWSGKPRP